MLNTRYSLAVLLFLTAACTGCTPPPSSEESVNNTPSNYMSEKTHSVDGHLFIGPQPVANDLQNIKTEGIQRVISFRTPEEIAELKFSQATLLAELGIDYVEIPVGGSQYPYSPAQLERLSEVLQKDGKVLLHCRSGYRASVITVAYLIEVQGMPIDEAVSHAEGWWPLELEKVLDEPLSLGRHSD
jgi:uncharacterized protein (TIGR01244 family)